MERRDFLKHCLLSAGALWLGDWTELFAQAAQHPAVGKPWAGWKKGQFQVHFIYTGVCESMFYIFPDGTTLLLDCGDQDALARNELAVPVLPNPTRHSGEWITRYVQRVNPQGNEVDYMMLSHYHKDHGGWDKFHAGEVLRDGEPYYLSGFSQAAETLHFHKAIDRCWPTYDDPLVPSPTDELKHMKQFYAYQQKHNGLQMEKFQVGAVNQLALQHDAASFADFKITNICGNGRILCKDGSVKDLYKERIARDKLTGVNENGMSIGMIMQYGDFRFYTAGDFSDSWKEPDGSEYRIEEALGAEIQRVNVAKINHHGHYSMPSKLVAALRAQVYVSCVWDQLHNVAPVMDTLSDKSIYPEDRLICPEIMPKERRAEDAGKSWLGREVPEACFEGGHVVLCVEPGGKDYTISYLTAADESMTVKAVFPFKA